MVSMFNLTTEGCGFDSHKIVISPLHEGLKEQEQRHCWLRDRLMCQVLAQRQVYVSSVGSETG